jgi:hypothetical protein
MNATDLYPTYLSKSPKYYDYGFDQDGLVNVGDGVTDTGTGNLVWNLTAHQWEKK